MKEIKVNNIVHKIKFSNKNSIYYNITCEMDVNGLKKYGFVKLWILKNSNEKWDSVCQLVHPANIIKPFPLSQSCDYYKLLSFVTKLDYETVKDYENFFVTSEEYKDINSRYKELNQGQDMDEEWYKNNHFSLSETTDFNRQILNYMSSQGYLPITTDD